MLVLFRDRVPRQNGGAATYVERMPKLRVGRLSDINEAHPLCIAEYKLFYTARHSSKALLKCKNIKLVEIAISKHIRQPLLPELAGISLARNALRQHLNVPT
jgi:hypothetical protein